MTAVISRFCGGCGEIISLWRVQRLDGKLVESCADCGSTNLADVRENRDSSGDARQGAHTEP